MILIPNNYTGIVVVVYDYEKGMPMEFRDGYRLYKIDSNGILFTQFFPTSGLALSDDLYYYVDRSIHIPIPYRDNISEANKSDSVFIFSRKLEIGFGKDGRQYKYAHFLVGKAKDADSLLAERERSYLPDKFEPKKQVNLRTRYR